MDLPYGPIVPYLFINRRQGPPGDFEILSLSTSAWRRVRVNLPQDYNFLFSDGQWALTARFEHGGEERFLLRLFCLQSARAKIIRVYAFVENANMVQPRSNDCVGTFTGNLDSNNYHIFLLEPPDNIVGGGGGTLWVSRFTNTLGDGEVENANENHEWNMYDFVPDDDKIYWERHQLHGNFDGAYSPVYWSQTLYWITATGVRSYNLHSREHMLYNLHPSFQFIDDQHGRGPRIYLASRDTGVIYVSVITGQRVRIGKLVNLANQTGIVLPIHQNLFIEGGAVLVNRGQGGIWIEDLSLLNDLDHLMDTISEGPPVPRDCGTYFFETNGWQEQRTCNLLNCQGFWFLSDDDRLGRIPLIYCNVPDLIEQGGGAVLPAAEAEEEEEDEEEEEEEVPTVIDQGTIKGNSLSSPNHIQETPDYIRRSNQRNIITAIELYSDEVSPENSATVLTVNSGELEKDGFYDGGDVVRACIDAGIETLYCSTRVGDFSYRFDQIEGGEYEVDLNFAEIMFTEGPPGMRVFDVFIQEKKVVSGLDVYEKVGGNKPFVLQNLRASVKGKEGLSIRFEGLVGKPIVCGISVRGECSSSSGIKDEVVPILGEVGKAKQDNKNKEEHIKCMEGTIQSLEMKNKSKDVLNRNLQDKIKELDSQLVVERKLAWQHADTKIAENNLQQHTLQKTNNEPIKEQEEERNSSPAIERVRHRLSMKPLTEIDTRLLNITTPTTTTKQNDAILRELLSLKEKENKPELLPAVKRLSLCPSAKRVPLNKPQFRRNSLATIPAANVLAPQRPSLFPSTSNMCAGGSNKKVSSILRMSLQKKVIIRPLLWQQAGKKGGSGLTGDVERPRMSIGCARRVLTNNGNDGGPSRVTTGRQLQLQLQRRDAERGWNQRFGSRNL